MDGVQFRKCDRLPGIRLRKASDILLTAFFVGCFLGSSSGCASTRSALMKANPAAASGAGQYQYSSVEGCVSPDCAAPQNVVSEKASRKTSAASGIAKPYPTQPKPVEGLPADGILLAPVPEEGMPTGSVHPPAELPSRLPEIAAIPFQPVPPIPASAEELSQCQNQLAEINQQISTLRETTVRAHQAMEVMAVEQLKLQQQNEQLRQRSEKADKQYIESMESLSQMIGEVLGPSAEDLTPAPSLPGATQPANQDSSAGSSQPVDVSP